MNTKDKFDACVICGSASFSWGTLESASASYVGDVPHRQGANDLRTGIILSIRFCNSCGNAQFFDPIFLQAKQKRKKDSV